jgi:DNA-binding MarR family transcriptional regulator
MLNQKLPTGTLDFLVRLRKIDKRSLTARDVLVLFAIIETPGSSGLEISLKLGLPDRSSLGSGLVRLEREGYIEDRREVRRKAHPAVLHATAKGLDFWDEIKP